ncbi:MAG TPA: exosortase/archaeosortase family protein [Gemmatimonadales bacterium]|nr:exosortase/archaeosortase family protein [Gemmatimonadales bacterium]
MTSVSITPVSPIASIRSADWKVVAPWLAAGLAFLVLFGEPMRTLATDWWQMPEAQHGLLLFPLALYLGWRAGLEPAEPRVGLGVVVLAGAVLLRYVAGVAEELFTMRASILVAAAGIVIYARGIGQLKRWWLPIALLALSIPLPAVVLGGLALPLQLKASQLGAWLLGWRHVPVRLAGNILYLPTRALFVTEACSGLRSLTALVAIGVLAGGLWLKTPLARLLLAGLAIPIALLLNSVRIFVAGFFVYYVDPGLADGIMHYTEGWVIFLVAFVLLAGAAWGLTRVEARIP